MKGEASYEFYIQGPKVIDVGFRPFISDVLYNFELPGRPVNDYKKNQVYAGVYGSREKVDTVHQYLSENHPKGAKVEKLTNPEKTAEPLHEIPHSFNDMHIYAAHLTLGQMNTFVQEAKKIETKLDKLDKLEDMNTSINELTKVLKKKFQTKKHQKP